jgi:hypothetical protein
MTDGALFESLAHGHYRYTAIQVADARQQRKAAS